MPAGVDRRLRPRRIVNWPHHEVQGADRYLLLVPRATVGLAGSGAGHTPDQEVSVRGAVRFPSTKWCRHGAGAFPCGGPAATVGPVATERSMGAAGHPTTVSRRPMGWSRRGGPGSIRLDHGEDIPCRIGEPGDQRATLPVDALGVNPVVELEPHTTRSEFVDHGPDVVDLEIQHRERRRHVVGLRIDQRVPGRPRYAAAASRSPL